ncbi:hypothetical protein Scep_024829 [Stephania cephalantha]|uniref:FAD-binding PCMH-type domain-containing protein n=1 Tax=Stephania cephalantha TaxID=152367 RepID=A0AAP0HYZ0_9MAGN
MSWIVELYDYMTPYVSKSPRTAFLNYKDLDLGRVRINGGATFVDPRIWGRMYFKNNFPRLVKAKSNVDPENFFSVLFGWLLKLLIQNGGSSYLCICTGSLRTSCWIFELKFYAETNKHGLKITVRSGGHDFEGLSYRANVPFVLIDLVNFRTIDVNIKDSSAWVQAGATLGEVYYRIARKARSMGSLPVLVLLVGVGGHISGGGFGLMVRKYGMAADHVLDARIINAKGEILDRKTMGEDLFWAIRGGGVTSFGVLLAWKIELVPVPPTCYYIYHSKNLRTRRNETCSQVAIDCKLWRSDELSIALHVGVVDTRQ